MAVHTKELSRQSRQTELERVDNSRSTTAPFQDTEEEEEVTTQATSPAAPDHTLDIDTSNLEGSRDTRSTSVSFACFQSDAFT